MLSGPDSDFKLFAIIFALISIAIIIVFICLSFNKKWQHAIDAGPGTRIAAICVILGLIIMTINYLYNTPEDINIDKAIRAGGKASKDAKLLESALSKLKGTPKSKYGLTDEEIAALRKLPGVNPEVLRRLKPLPTFTADTPVETLLKATKDIRDGQIISPILAQKIESGEVVLQGLSLDSMPDGTPIVIWDRTPNSGYIYNGIKYNSRGKAVGPVEPAPTPANPDGLGEVTPTNGLEKAVLDSASETSIPHGEENGEATPELLEDASFAEPSAKQEPVVELPSPTSKQDNPVQ